MNTVNRKPTVGRTPEAFVDLLSVGIIGINKKKFLNKRTPNVFCAVVCWLALLY
jgi:hypothetical protein